MSSTMQLRGLGLWIAFHRDAIAKFGGTWRALAKRCRELGVSWIAPRVGQSARSGEWTSSIARAATAACHEEGVRVLPWWYSMPGAWKQEVALAKSLLEDGVDGLMIDAEIEWTNKHAEAKAFTTALRAELPDAYIAHAPLAWLPYHPQWPYEIFGDACDSVHPQLYWTELKRGSYSQMMAEAAPSWDAWVAAGRDGAKGFAPIGCTYGNESAYAAKAPGRFRAQDLRAFLERYKDRECLSLYSIEAAAPECWDVLRERAAALRAAPTVEELENPPSSGPETLEAPVLEEDGGTSRHVATLEIATESFLEEARRRDDDE